MNYSSWKLQTEGMENMGAVIFFCFFSLQSSILLIFIAKIDMLHNNCPLPIQYFYD